MTLEIEPRTLQQETPMEFFKERVEKAISHQRIRSGEDIACYLSRLLESFIRPKRLFSRAGVEPGVPLAEIYCEAMTSHGHRRYQLFKLAGDLALFVSGFCSESLNRKPVGCGYYVELGGRAYGTLHHEHRSSKDLFGELSIRFGQFADVLSEVSEECSLTDDRNLLRLYERWLETRSRRSAATLRDHGILVVPASSRVN